MQNSKLESVRNELQFIGRTLSNGYLDMDTLDELGRSVSSALHLLSEYESEQLPSNVIPFPTRITLYEPPHAA